MSGFMTQGWVCPKCGRVNSPYTSYCQGCTIANTQQQETGDFRDDVKRESQQEYFGKK